MERMTIRERISNILRRSDRVLWQNLFSYGWGDLFAERLPFADAIFLNICDILTDLANDIEWVNKDGDPYLFAEFVAFYNAWGKTVLNRLAEAGYVVIGYKGIFRILKENEDYRLITDAKGVNEVCPLDAEMKIYTMKSSTYLLKGKSDREICAPFLSFLDNVLNASNTVSSRLGALVVMCPEQQAGLPTQVTLTKEQKSDLEKQTESEYGALSKQKQLMILPRSMRTSIINLSGLDLRTIDKARLAILAVCDRMKVPANQVAIIDANSSKSLANGTELREGDFNKYQSFERLINSTFVQMAAAFDIPLTYNIYNKPQRAAIG